jgi:serine/threonine protein kinase
MALSAGTRLGPYEIIARIGAGGMGEVWKARDSRLGRTVAIKTSNAKFSQRFEREARVIAALNHPHICTLYDVGPDYLVMEYVEGAELVGPLPLGQALQYAVEIAGALEAAHAKEITHRDLKPANILVTRAGVKVLDFGLAKIDRPDASPVDETLTQGLTQQGSIVGTLQYMAPEQLQGETADARADIFALGCVFYEMLAGKRAFDGASAASVIAAILERPAPTVIEIAPPVIDWVLSLCLAKDPNERWQSAHDLRATLEQIAQRGADFEPVPRRRRPAFAWIVAASVFVAVATIMMYFRPYPKNAPEMRLDIVTPPTNAPGSFALSPDGKRIAYAATVDGISRLWVRSMDSTTPQPLAGTDDALNPFWSPDGRSLGFLSGFELKRIDVEGGKPQTLVQDIPPMGVQAAWSANGTILFGSGSASLSRLPESGGRPAAATKLENGQSAHRVPRFLPDGRKFLFLADGADPAIWMRSLDDGLSRRLTTIAPGADSSAEYLAPGWLVRVRQNALIAQPFDADRGQLGGNFLTLSTAVAVDPDSQSGSFSVSASGAIAWRGGEGARRELTWYDRRGQRLGVLNSDDPAPLNPELSPNGKRVAITSGRTDVADIWILEGNHASRFTFDPADDRIPIWSRDGTRVAFASNRKGRMGLYQKRTDGIGSEEVLLQLADEDTVPVCWSPDGRYILYKTVKNGGDLMVLPVGGGKPFAFLNSPFNEDQGAFSPDGKWVAYGSNETGRFEVYVRPFPGPGRQVPISTNGGNSPRWRPDGKELYFVAPDRKLMAAAVMVTGVELSSGTPETLFQTHMTRVPDKQQYDVAGDGRFLVLTELREISTEPIHLLLNWTQLRK